MSFSSCSYLGRSLVYILHELTRWLLWLATWVTLVHPIQTRTFEHLSEKSIVARSRRSFLPSQFIGLASRHSNCDNRRLLTATWGSRGGTSVEARASAWPCGQKLGKADNGWAAELVKRKSVRWRHARWESLLGARFEGSTMRTPLIPRLESVLTCSRLGPKR